MPAGPMRDGRVIPPDPSSRGPPGVRSRRGPRGKPAPPRGNRSDLLPDPGAIPWRVDGRRPSRRPGSRGSSRRGWRTRDAPPPGPPRRRGCPPPWWHRNTGRRGSVDRDTVPRASAGSRSTIIGRVAAVIPRRLAPSPRSSAILPEWLALDVDLPGGLLHDAVLLHHDLAGRIARAALAGTIQELQPGRGGPAFRRAPRRSLPGLAFAILRRARRARPARRACIRRPTSRGVASRAVPTDSIAFLSAAWAVGS